jgi:putative alpha-1,2-mannosidase
VSQRYSLGSPIFDEITIHLHPTYYGGDALSVRSLQGPGEIYIRSASFNGHPISDASITHQEIGSGGELVLEMSAEPNL